MAQRYTVLNPRAIQAGFRIFRISDRAWYEGDAFTKPKGFSTEEVDALVERGFLEEASNG